MKLSLSARWMALTLLGALTAALTQAPSAQKAIAGTPETPFKLATFDVDNRMRVGVVVGTRIIDAAAASAYLSDHDKLSKVAVPADMKAIIERYDAISPRLYQIANALGSSNAALPFAYDLAKVAIKAPIMYPGNVLAIAANYKAHAEGMGATEASRPTSASSATPPPAPPSGFNAAAASQIVPDRDAPIFFAKSPRSCIIASGEPFYIPDGRERTDWEGELAVVIGREGYMVPKEKAHDYVFGYSIMYDVSDRGSATPRRVVSMFSGTNWFEGKSTDRGAPFGPFIVPKEFLPNAYNLHLVTRVNGVVKQDANTKDMIWDEAHQIQYLTSILTLYPGDVISTGTPSGTGAERQQFLKPGDVVTIDIDGIGTLTTPMRSQRERPATKITDAR